MFCFFQKISGIGNYILAEGLYRAKIDPFCSLHEISEESQRVLFRELQSTALQSYQVQGLTRPGGSYRDAEGKRGRFEFQLQCYGRTVCAKGAPVQKEIEGPHGRTIWYTEDQLFMPRAMRHSVNSDDDDEEVTRSKLQRAKAVQSGTVSPTTKTDLNKAIAKNEQVNIQPITTLSRQGGSVGGDDSSQIQHTLDGCGPVESLLVGLKDDSWKTALADTLKSEEFRKLAFFVAHERSQGVVVYPPEDEVFAALNLCPLDGVKVVIVGQDPYHGPGQGHGLSFSVRPPPSLQNIIKEAQNDVGIDPPVDGHLACWTTQGVLLLNAVLTVRMGEANSHAQKGWEHFTDAVIKTLNDERDGIVFLLWGKAAQLKASSVDETRHTVIRTSHPSPLGASKTDSPFLGSRCFSRTNKILEAAGRTPINWNLR
jgi:uracil-DNA glycosylase